MFAAKLATLSVTSRDHDFGIPEAKGGRIPAHPDSHA
jgi:hypothetical protein